MSENPIAPDGAPNGTDAPDAPVAAHRAPARPTDGPAALAAHLAGEPGTLPPTWCRVCEATVQPEGKGRCPRCQAFLKQNFAARRHPQNKLRCQQIRDQLVVDYSPQTTMMMASCEHLAGILEQLEVLKPGTPDHQRLVQLSQSLGETLEASRAARSTRTPSERPGLETMPESALRLAEQLLARQIAGEVLTDRELGQLDVLNALMDGGVR